jgi:CDGSH-type Zn-finger protein
MEATKDGTQDGTLDGTRIRPLKDGPLEITGKLTMVDVAGAQQPVSEDSVYLCRCGQSANKPFCDGSHKKAGFEAPGWQRVSSRT